jgi:hypothetical protein
MLQGAVWQCVCPNTFAKLSWLHSAPEGMEKSNRVTRLLPFLPLQVLTDIVELLTGKTMTGKVKVFSPDKSRAAEQLLQHYQAVLEFLERHGALMNSVQAEHLLDPDTLDQVLQLREARAESDADVRSCELWCASPVSLFLTSLWATTERSVN